MRTYNGDKGFGNGETFNDNLSEGAIASNVQMFLQSPKVLSMPQEDEITSRRESQITNDRLVDKYEMLHNQNAEDTAVLQENQSLKKSQFNAAGNNTIKSTFNFAFENKSGKDYKTQMSGEIG